MTLAEFVRERGGGDAMALAREWLKVATEEELLQLAYRAIRDQIRVDVRAVEIMALKTVRERKSDSSELLADLAPLLDEPYRIGDGRVRRFGELTSDEHRARIQMLGVQMLGLKRDIELHEAAIALIDARGVSCLDDLARVTA